MVVVNGWRTILNLLQTSFGRAGTELKKGSAGLLGVSLVGSITEGGGRSGEVVPRGGGALEGRSDGGIRGVGGIGSGYKEPWMEGGHVGKNKGVPVASRAQREGGRLRLEEGSPSLPFQEGQGERFDNPPAIGGGWTDACDGAMTDRLLFDGGSYQVDHGLGPLAAAPNRTLGGGGNPKDPQPGW